MNGYCRTLDSQARTPAENPIDANRWLSMTRERRKGQRRNRTIASLLLQQLHSLGKMIPPTEAPAIAIPMTNDRLARTVKDESAE
jgi:hypothetical protein